MSFHRFVITMLVLALAGCASHAPVPVEAGRTPVRVEPLNPGTSQGVVVAGLYTVKKGDTLYSVALDHGVDYRDLAAWNNIENINRIRVGQQLRLSAPGTAVASGAAPDAGLPPASAGSTEIRPIAVGGPVVARPLEGAASTGATAVSPAPTFATDNTAKLKHSPKGGTLPYSEENLALLRAQAAAPMPVVATPPAAAPVATSTPATPAPEKPTVEKPAPAPVPTVPAAAAGDGEVDWAWPASGKVIGTFNNDGSAAQEASKGIDIAGKIGDPVQAAANGKVVYVGNGLRGYGNLVIVRHSAAFLSAYAHNNRVLVKEGQAVTKGQKIAELGNSDADQPKLHFEVRQQGKPVDPLKFLPSR
jgi:lipoprotein NlpD